MATYLERYLNGEYEQVWAELLAFGDQVQQEPLHTDAVAVARETMTRAKYNVELLYQRLTSFGYKFEYPDIVLSAPSPDILDKIARVESEIGALPLSLRTWHEIVGGVYFSGTHPRLSICERDYVEGLENEITSDPLCVYSLDALLEYGFYASKGIKISPDTYHKAGFSGGLTYRIPVHNNAIDGPLLYEWHGTTFVNCLRISFRWGGFPGFDSAAWPSRVKEVRAWHISTPHDLIAALTQGLKPI